MCRIDDSERSTVLRSGTPKAKKPHRCSECRRQIAPGETYLVEATTYDGYFDTFKTCAHCQIGREWLIKNCGGFIYGEVWEEVQEHGEEYRNLKLPLFRVIVGARRKWQRFGGGLMPVPALPPEISVQEHH